METNHSPVPEGGQFGAHKSDGAGNNVTMAVVYIAEKSLSIYESKVSVLWIKINLIIH